MARPTDLHILPRIRDSWTYLYVEHCRLEQEGKAVALHDAKGVVLVPCATLSLLMVGPGVSITHAAVSVLAANGCAIVWCGEGGTRFYAVGLGETNSAANLMHQARLWSDSRAHMEVVVRMYRMRFREPPASGLGLRQLRGVEGIRVREAYRDAARQAGVEWTGRRYTRNEWASADPLNRALSAANACLYGVCHAAIVASGFAPGLGFIHTGKALSFVYDVADLYKTDVTLPVAFRESALGSSGLEQRVRRACRGAFLEQRLLARIVPDIARALGLDSPQASEAALVDSQPALPGSLWEPEGPGPDGGVNYAEEDVDGGADPGESSDEPEG